MYPKLDRVKELAAEGKYRRIPVCQEILSDSYTPIEVMRRLREVSRQVYLLESAGQSENWGRYTFLGYEPSLEITCRDGRVVIKKTDALGKKLLEQREVLHPGEVIREIIAQNKTPIMENMPSFTGGLVGYFSYDYIKYSEPKLHLSSGEEDDFNDMDLMLFDRVIAFDNFKQKIYLIAGVYTEELEASYEMAKDKIEEMARVIKYGDKKVFQPLELLSDITPQFTADEYADMVKKAKHYIHEGDIFQVVLSNPLRAKARGSLFDTYRILRSSNPSPYMFYFSSDDIEIAGASPETLVKVVDGKASTFPLAGTRPRGKDEAEDKALEQELLADEKELAEHNMLVDLGRNDEVTIPQIEEMKPDAIIISPGPGKPKDAGICEEAICFFAGKIPILGICLGHQAICEAFGATVSYAKELMHGKKKEMIQENDGLLFKGMPNSFYAARYHSLAVMEDTLPEELIVTARCEDGEVMAVEHRDYPIFGLQFHPESVMTPEGKKIIENFCANAIMKVNR